METGQLLPPLRGNGESVGVSAFRAGRRASPSRVWMRAVDARRYCVLFVIDNVPKSRGLTGPTAPAGCTLLPRDEPPRLRGDTASSRSNTPREVAFGCIQGVLHCSDGIPRLPACRDNELARLCHKVKRRTRSWALNSAISRPSEVSRRIGASITECSLLAETSSRRPCFRGRNSVAENACGSGRNAPSAKGAGNDGSASCVRDLDSAASRSALTAAD